MVDLDFPRLKELPKGHHLISTREKLIKARLGMLALAEQLNNVSLACKRANISRSRYYEIKEACDFGSGANSSEA